MDGLSCFSETEKAMEMELMWFKNHKGQDPTIANRTLWNTMPLVSASLLDTMFKDTVVMTHRIAAVNLNVESGVFGYEFELASTDGTDQAYNWRASEEELVLINRKLQRFLNSQPQIYGLDVNLTTCERIFGLEVGILIFFRYLGFDRRNFDDELSVNCKTFGSMNIQLAAKSSPSSVERKFFAYNLNDFFWDSHSQGPP